MDLSFFDVPVYRVTEASYNEDRALYAGTAIQDFSVDDELQRDRDLQVHLKGHLQTKYGGAWRYNEIIGYIRLYFFGYQIRGEWWRMNAKRVTRTRKKQFEWRTSKLSPERRLSPTAGSAEIFEVVLGYLEACKKKLKRWHVDTSLFEVVGPYVDWRALLESNFRKV